MCDKAAFLELKRDREGGGKKTFGESGQIV